MADPWNPQALLPGTEELPPPSMRENAGDFAHGLAVGTARPPVSVMNLIQQMQGYEVLDLARRKEAAGEHDGSISGLSPLLPAF